MKGSHFLGGEVPAPRPCPVPPLSRRLPQAPPPALASARRSAAAPPVRLEGTKAGSAKSPAATAMPRFGLRSRESVGARESTGPGFSRVTAGVATWEKTRVCGACRVFSFLRGGDFPGFGRDFSFGTKEPPSFCFVFRIIFSGGGGGRDTPKKRDRGGREAVHTPNGSHNATWPSLPSLGFFFLGLPVPFFQQSPQN